jgi:hypothetical protein
MPDWLEPMAATRTEDRFTGGDWLFERKFDGIRLLAYKRGGDVRLYSRNRLPQNLPALTAAIASLPVDEVILDGEVTWDGRSAYHVFDILWLNGRLLTALPLEERRALLEALPLRAPVRLVEELDDEIPWERARREGWEGVIAKRRGSPYEHRRSKHWLKMKCEASQELVVGGFTDPQGTRVGLGALLVALRRAGPRVRGKDRHRLRYDAPPRPSPAAGCDRGPGAAVHKGHGPAENGRALDAARDRRAGRVRRMDRARQAAPPAADWHPAGQESARGPPRIAVIAHRHGCGTARAQRSRTRREY